MSWLEELFKGLTTPGGYQSLGNGNMLPSQTMYGPQQPQSQQAQPQQGYGGYMQRPSTAESIATILPFLNLPNQQSQYMQPAYNTFAAAANSNSPQFQQVYGEQKQQGQENLAESIMELSRQNRKLSMLGRAPLFDPERGGETQFRGLTQGYQDIQHQAANDTRGILGTLAQNQAIQGAQQGQIAANKAGVKGNLYGAAAQALPFLSKLFSL